MSSPLLRTLAEDPAALHTAAATVAETSFFTYLDVLDAETFAAAVATTPGEWLQARLTFTGPASGTFALALPVALARRLLVAFTGAEPTATPGPDALVDFAAEMANIICGAWLTAACRQASFDLSAPVVTSGPAEWPAPASTHAQTAHAAIDDAPVRIDVAVTALEGAAVQ